MPQLLIAVALPTSRNARVRVRVRAHAQAAQRSGASEAEIMKAIWVAAVMRSGGADAHSLVARAPARRRAR
jgi:alkylhydroperoxidase/carboxymuconolactone decarboxylase family protein YurZ